jgi:decaprenyl-phosphate phosphoribosyltransferase
MTDTRPETAAVHAGRTDTPATWSPERTRGDRLGALVAGCRPRQWTKNLLVLAAPVAAAHEGFGPHQVLGALVAALTFCAVSSAVYLVNDVRDAEADRRHPTKRHRPVASGRLSPQRAITGALLLCAGALAVGAWWRPELAVVLATYLLLQAAYSAELKHRAGLDLLVIAVGFVLRVVAGGIAAGVEVSAPFLLLVGAGSLFMIAGKRYSEMLVLGASAGTRRSLGGYSVSSLRLTWTTAAVVTAAAYAVGALGFAELGTPEEALTLFSVPLFVAGLARYAQHVQRGEAGCPEEVAFGDPALAVLGVAWLVPVLLAVAGA